MGIYTIDTRTELLGFLSGNKSIEVYGASYTFSEILKAFEKFEVPVIFPVHPRIRKFVNG